MAEDRMLSDEVLLALIKKNSGGGGGGTNNYNDLSNQPQINGNTLIGNKTASDLGLVAAETGKGLSENDYTDADKAIVGGVTAALAGKQGALTAGKYIGINANNKISVEREIPDEAFTYTIQQTGDGIVKITKTVNGAVVFEETYSGDVDVTLDALRYVYSRGVQSYTLLIASDTHEAGFKQVMSWWQRETYTENFSTVDHSGEKLVIKSELDAALALKQDKTDNSLQTTDKTVVGAVNELKSGLTNLTNDVKLNTQDLTTPSRTKNLLPLTLEKIKSSNTAGTWNNNEYTVSSCVFTVNTNAQGQVISIDVSNANTTPYVSALNIPLPKNNNKYKFCGGGSDSYDVLLWDNTTNARAKKWDGSTNSESSTNVTVLQEVLNVASDNIELRCRVNANTPAGSATYYPLLVSENETDPTFAPYIPSVDARLDAVESKQMVKTSETVTLNANGVSRLSLTLSQGRIVYAIKVGGGNDAYLVLPYCTTVDGGVWAVKVVDPTDMSPIASAEVTIAYGYLP